MRPPGLAHRRIVVVARHFRRERRVTARPPAEGRAAVRHVHREARLVLQHPLEILEAVRRVLDVMDLSPRVEPCGIVLAAHKRPLRRDLTKFRKRRLWIGPEVDDLQELGNRAVRNLSASVTREKWHLEAGRAERVVNRAHVLLVVAVAAVLVLGLHHQDRSALRDLQRREHLADLGEIALRRLQVLGVSRPHPDAVPRQKPPWETALVPLGAGVGAGTENDPESFLLRDAAELRDVLVRRREVELALLLLVEVPEHIRADGVESACADHLQAMPPVLWRDAREVNLSAADDERLAVQQKRPLADGERMRLLGRTQAKRRADYEQRQHEFSHLHSFLLKWLARIEPEKLFRQ